jgi:hypothetical protein
MGEELLVAYVQTSADKCSALEVIVCMYAIKNNFLHSQKGGKIMTKLTHFIE